MVVTVNNHAVVTRVTKPSPRLGQGTFHTVECHEHFTRARTANAEVVFRYVSCVVGVRWLTKFQHHKVRCVNDVVNRAHARRRETLHDPVR